MYVRTREGLGQVVAAINLDRAVCLNRHYARLLGWQAHVSYILRILGFATYIPGERTFAEAVARWQRCQGLPVDGIIMPATWSRMRVPIGAQNLSRDVQLVRQALGQFTARQLGNEKESPKHEEILKDLTREMEKSTGFYKRILSAMRAFSINQLRRMQSAGVRFWRSEGVPPAFEGIVKAPELPKYTKVKRALYVPTVRIIRLSDSTTSDDIRHELAHAWDNIRAAKGLLRLDRLKKESERRSAFEREKKSTSTWSFLSDSDQRFDVSPKGSKRKLVLTIKQMLERYRDRPPKGVLGFDNPQTHEGHSLKSPQEFYAEGYSVFHGPYQDSQARLLESAPELFQFLENEAKKEGLATPNRADLERLIP